MYKLAHGGWIMNKQDNAAGVAMKEASSLIEGGLFYPVGHIVAGFPDQQDARQVYQKLLAHGLSQDECVLVSAAAMVEAAAEDLDSGGVIAAFGSTAQIREKQLQLAREGCHFLMVKVSSDEGKDLVLKELAQVPVRYAVQYYRLAIENLIAHISSATADSGPARTG
jgi:hypothetical protein